MTRLRAVADDRSDPPSEPTLYQRLLGDDFGCLPPLLRAFHSRSEGATASGKVDVERPGRWLSRRIARAAGLPSPGGELPLMLRVEPQGEAERWLRRIGDSQLNSLQWQEGNCLVEQFGRLCLVFQVLADSRGMTFLPIAVRRGARRLPGWLGPRVEASILGDDDTWTFDVSIAAPLVGLLTRCHGTVRPHL